MSASSAGRSWGVWIARGTYKVLNTQRLGCKD
jgi:hypothetical protein